MNSLPFQQILCIIVGGEKESNESLRKADDIEIGIMKGAKISGNTSVQFSSVQFSSVQFNLI